MNPVDSSYANVSTGRQQNPTGHSYSTDNTNCQQLNGLFCNAPDLEKVQSQFQFHPSMMNSNIRQSSIPYDPNNEIYQSQFMGENNNQQNQNPMNIQQDISNNQSQNLFMHMNMGSNALVSNLQFLPHNQNEENFFSRNFKSTAFESTVQNENYQTYLQQPIIEEEDQQDQQENQNEQKIDQDENEPIKHQQNSLNQQSGTGKKQISIIQNTEILMLNAIQFKNQAFESEIKSESKINNSNDQEQDNLPEIDENNQVNNEQYQEENKSDQQDQQKHQEQQEQQEQQGQSDQQKQYQNLLINVVNQQSDLLNSKQLQSNLNINNNLQNQPKEQNQNQLNARQTTCCLLI